LTKNLSPGDCLIEKSDVFDFLPMAYRLLLKFEIPGISKHSVVCGILKHKGKNRKAFGIQSETIDKKDWLLLRNTYGNFPVGKMD